MSLSSLRRACSHWYSTARQQLFQHHCLKSPNSAFSNVALIKALHSETIYSKKCEVKNLARENDETSTRFLFIKNCRIGLKFAVLGKEYKRYIAMEFRSNVIVIFTSILHYTKTRQNLVLKWSIILNVTFELHCEYIHVVITIVFS